MGDTSIEWTDKSWSPVTGCKAVSPGCLNCYAARLSATRLKGLPAYVGLAYLGGAGRAVWSGEVRLHPDRLGQPLHWRQPKKVFVCDMSDLFHDDVPDSFIDRVFGVMALAPRHTFQVLTKRAERFSRWFSGRHPEDAKDRVWGQAYALCPAGGPPQGFFPGWEGGYTLSGGGPWPLPNVWAGVSVEDQRRAEERVPLLCETPAAVRFLSCEPLLGPLDLSPWLPRLGWVICGGESGPGARPMAPAWALGLAAQCKRAGVAYFCKQLGAAAARHAGWRDPKGADPVEWAEPSLVREYPPPPLTATAGTVLPAGVHCPHGPERKPAGPLPRGPGA